jgi:small acid-soluble spore protein H (minor)
MNKQRAKEIASSPIMANVICEGVPIYIQHVDDQNETARIYPLEQPDNEKDVPIDNLIELH